MKKTIKAVSVLCCALLVACVYLVGCATDPDSAKRYAELRIGSEDEFQILICAEVWRGIWVHDGFGGYSKNIFYWSNLKGRGPVYVDPNLTANSYKQNKYKGTITINRDEKQVVINLMKIVSGLGEAEKLEPCPINGTYRIKSVNHDRPDPRQ